MAGGSRNKGYRWANKRKEFVMRGSFERWPCMVIPFLGDHGGAPADSPIMCLPGARASDDGTLHTHLRSTCGRTSWMRLAAAKPPRTLPALELRLPNEKGNLMQRRNNLLGKRWYSRVGRDDNLYVEGAHERTRQ